MRIAVYGGSFNPPHLGHVLAAKTVLSEIKPDILLIIPDREPPHKEMADNSPSAEKRLELCKAAFAALPGVQVSDMELKRQGKSYTADTIRELRALYADAQLYLTVGTDMALSFEQWYDFRYILSECTLTVLAREGDDSESLAAMAEHLRRRYGAKVELLSHKPMEISSSRVRQLLPERRGTEYLTDSVYSLIVRERIYGAKPDFTWLRLKAFSLLDDRRKSHVAGVENEAVKLARIYGVSEDDARCAALLHDCTKRLKRDEQLELCARYGLVCTPRELERSALLHSKTGAEYARREFGVSDTVSEAISWHTTGKPGMSKLEKIVYLADTIEPSRTFDGVEELRALSYRDLDAAMVLALELTAKKLGADGLDIEPETVETLEYYKKASKGDK